MANFAIAAKGSEMETTYTIIGADGQQYGPISLEQVKAWVGERRITPETKVMRSDIKSWLPAAQYTELGVEQQAGGAAVATAMAPPQRLAAAPNVAEMTLARRVRLGARWFFWIAGLSLVNTVLAMSKTGMVFVVGLGVTQFIDGFTGAMGSQAPAIGLVLNVIVAGIFASFGVFAAKGHIWSFIVGMILYLMDALLILGVSLWAKADLPVLELGFHAFALFCLFAGLKAAMELKRLTGGLAIQPD